MKKFLMFTMILLMSKTLWAGTVSGTVSFNGTAPPVKNISMAADPTCMAAHAGGAVHAETVAVNDNGTLRNVFVYIKTGLEGKTFETPAKPVMFDQKGCQYHPHVLGVQVNQPFLILNSDSTLHNVHSLAENSKQFNLGMPIQGMKLKKKFTKPEVMVKVKCDVHPWMTAYVGVLPHPYFSVTGEDGQFEIKNLPAGTYTLEAWHEKFGTQTKTVTVTDAPAPADFSFGS